jgi:hypothetical protein
VGRGEGKAVGTPERVGRFVGCDWGALVGLNDFVGRCVGGGEGCTDGCGVGDLEGGGDGGKLGRRVGREDGAFGIRVGSSEGEPRIWNESSATSACDPDPCATNCSEVAPRGNCVVLVTTTAVCHAASDEVCCCPFLLHSGVYVAPLSSLPLNTSEVIFSPYMW